MEVSCEKHSCRFPPFQFSYDYGFFNRHGTSSQLALPVKEAEPQPYLLGFSGELFWLRCSPHTTNSHVSTSSLRRTSTNVLRIRNCSIYSETMTSHALGELAANQRTLLHIQSIVAYLFEAQSCQIWSRSG